MGMCLELEGIPQLVLAGVIAYRCLVEACQCLLGTSDSSMGDGAALPTPPARTGVSGPKRVTAFSQEAPGLGNVCI